MNEDRLRRWADNALTPEEAREVYRWMVRCTDPDLPLVLSGLMRERREREADRGLSGRGAFWGRLVEGWQRLVGEGHALWTQPGLGPLPAALEDAVAPEVWLDEGQDGAVVLELDVAAELQVVVFVSDDRPSLIEVFRGRGGRRTIGLPKVGSRPTAWVFVGKVLASGMDAAASLEVLLDDLEVSTTALRWEP